MPFNEKFVTRSDIPLGVGIDGLLQALCLSKGLVAAILCELHEDKNFDLISAWPVPAEALRGGEKIHVETLISECMKFPAAHCHAINTIGIGNVMHRLRNEVPSIHRCWFVPAVIEGRSYLFFGFPSPTVAEKNVPEKFVHDLFTLIEAKHAVKCVEEHSARIEIIERYVKEAGHDIASAVQATIAKLRNISDGHIPVEFIGLKAKEAELEIMAAYRVASGLGLTMEPNYQVRDFAPFDIIDVCNHAVQQQVSEAQERNITLSMRSSSGSLMLVGDKQAFEQLLGHLLSNAIKYSFGSTGIYINIDSKKEYASIKVQNKGIPLPIGPDAKKIYDFGFRGSNDAKLRHVNGSGIGLYTVKKITLAHHGTISAWHDSANQMTTFEISVPLASYLRKHNPEVFIEGIAKGRGN